MGSYGLMGCAWACRFASPMTLQSFAAMCTPVRTGRRPHSKLASSLEVMLSACLCCDASGISTQVYPASPVLRHACRHVQRWPPQSVI